MGKILLTKKNIDQYISKDKDKIYIEKDMILSPSAKDVIRNMGKIIVYGDEPKESLERKHSDLDTIEKSVIEILKTNYKITDSEEINEICSIVLNKINKK